MQGKLQKMQRMQEICKPLAAGKQVTHTRRGLAQKYAGEKRIGERLVEPKLPAG
jgi:hypothetical protein